MRVHNINTLIRMLAATAILVLTGSASAAMISGDLTFSGDFDYSGSLGGATSLTFPGGDFGVDGSNGDFAAILQNDIGTINTLDFIPNGSIFVSISGFDFVLDSINNLYQTDQALLLTGTGTVSGNGIMATPVDFIFTGNVIGSLNNFSAGFSATPIPIPGALVLFGSAVFAMGMGARRN